MTGLTLDRRPAPARGAALPLVPEVLRDLAVRRGDRVAYRFLKDGEEEVARWTWREVDRRARAVAAALDRTGSGPGTGEAERALLLYPPGLDFVAALLGCFLAGVVAVPTYPPRRRDDRLRAIVGDARPTRVLTTADAEDGFRRRTRDLAALPGALWIATDALDSEGPESAPGWQPPRLEPSHPALLQYTSGSTGDPRGVVVEAGQLAHNERLIQGAFEQDEESVIVSWLPTYHDMGLIGGVLQPLWAGASCVMMSPGAFLRRPARWLRAISHYRATTSGGPNFAYDLCVRRVTPEERESFDLSSWRVAFDGAEPVHSGTLERFAHAFAGSGFDRRAFFPCYGLAEATLLVAGGPREAAPVTATVDREALADGRVEASAPGRVGARTLVASGRPVQEVRIVDPESLRPAAAGSVGEIWVAGEGVAAGYWRRAEATGETFRARLADDPSREWLRTGDLGFLDASENPQLFVTGRLKDLVILRGRNHYPNDLERTAELAHPDLAPGSTAAFAVSGDGEERLVIVAEAPPRAGEKNVRSLAAAVRRAVAQEHEAQVAEVVVVKAGTLPRTSSGKVQRRRARELHRRGGLEALGRSALTPRTDGPLPEAEAGGVRRELAALPAERRSRILLAALGQMAVRSARLEADAVPADAPLSSLGLDSLAAVELSHAVERALELEVTPADLLEAESLEALATVLADRLASESAPAGPRPLESGPRDERPRPLSPAQRTIWFVDRLAPGRAVYNLSGALRIDGLDEDAFRRAAARLTVRHGALRTAIGSDRGEPFRRVLAETAPAVRVVEGRAWDRERLRRELAAEAARPFDLERPPLLRFVLVRLRGGAHAAQATAHHAVTDFWSWEVLLRDLEAAYRRELSAGDVPAELGPEIDFDDYLAWHEARLAEHGEAWLDAWVERLRGAPGSLDLPTDRPRPAVRSFRGATVRRFLPAGLADDLEALARRRGATRFALLLAAFQGLLHRWSGQDDLVVGTPTAGRAAAALRDLVGCFVNPVALRADLSDDPPFERFLDTTRDRLTEALHLQELPFGRVVERLVPERDAGSQPLFQSLFVVHRPHDDALGDLAARAVLGLDEDPGEVPAGSFAGLGATPLTVPSDTALFDLTLTLAEVAARGERRLGAALEVDAALFDRTTAERWLRRYEILLRAVTEGPGERLSRLPLWSPEERWQVLGEWSGPTPARRGPETWDGLYAPFAESARRVADAVALDLEDGGQWSYGGLARRVGALAARLRARGVGPDVPVGVRLERGADLVVAILAVLEAGGAYVPIDPAYPPSRVDFLLADSGVGLLIRPSGAGAGAAPEGVEEIDPADRIAAPDAPAAPSDPVPPEALSHLVYTSGSTGTPKGVAIPRRAAAALVRWALSVWSPDKLEAVAAVTSVCFDLSVFELFVPFAAGGRVVLARDALALPEHPGAGRVRLLNTVPSAVAELLRADRLPASVRTVNLAGEPLAPELAAAVLAAPGVDRLFDLYGPSEDTTYSTGQAVRAGEPARIGRPIAGTTVDLCDRRLQPVPPGAVGEICLGGLGLARGYAGRPAATAAVFVPDPLAGRFGRPPGARLYRTGDMARFDAEGRLAFLGRRDHQVKLRGFRIELGEVEAALRSHPAVEEAAVAVRGAETPAASLIAYVVASDGAEPSGIDPEAVRRHVGERLPRAMVPARVVVLDALPRTLTGKLDRAALRAPDIGAQVAGEAPRTPAEERVADLFGRLLERSAVGREDDFFRLGGHSLLAARLVAELRETTDADLSLQEVFQAPTVAALARRIERRRDDERLAEPAIPRRDPAAGPPPASFAQERIWFLERLTAGTTAYHVPFALELRGRLDADALRRALAGAMERHESLRTAFRETDDGLVQEIEPAGAVPPVTAVDLRACGGVGDGLEAAAEAIARDFVRRPFDLCRAPLWRAALLRLGEERHRLLVVLHHSVADGRSLDVLAREIAAGYRAALGVEVGEERPRAGATPADLAEWERRRWRAGEMEDALRRAVERLGDRPEPLALPTDRPRGTGAVRRGAVLPVRLDGALVRGLDALGREGGRERRGGAGATRFMVLLALYEVLLGRWSGQLRVSVGFPFARRDRPETRDSIGLLANTLVISGDLSGGPSFLEHLDAVRERALAAYADRDLPFERLVETLAPGRHLGRNPLFQAAFALQPATPRPELPGLAVEVRALDAGGAKFDLSLVLYPADGPGDDGGLVGELEYDRELFDRATIHRLRRSFETLARAAVDDPVRPVDRLPLLGPAETHQAVVEWNDTESPTRLPWVLDAVAARAAERPDAVALDEPAGAWSYGRTMGRVLTLAAGLERLGVGPEAVVAIAHPRSAEQIVAALAVMAAGGAYLPIDPAYPASRQEILLTDSGAHLLLAPVGAPIRELPGPWRSLGLAEVATAADGAALDAPRRPVSVDQPAYVIYTSGSTGRPKGVVIPHRGLRGLLSWHAGRFALGPDDRATALSGVGFDASVYEVWPALTAGSRLCLPAPDLVADPPALGRWLEAERITLTFLATPVAEAVLGESDLGGSALRWMLVGGDRLRRRPPADVAWEMVNSYGPTEDSVVATVDRVAPRGAVAEAAEGRPPSIGRPLDDQRAGVVGSAGDRQPVGAVGELVLSGVGLARGYLGRPAETARRFVPDPEAPSPGARRYRTGDRVRRMPDGRLDFLGRVDDQIQVRGQRVEPGEVEATLATHPAVRDAVVVVREDADGAPRMIAYAVAAATDGEGLRAWLADRLPSAMVPAVVVVLDALPLTPHGKVDRRALPAPPAPGRAAGGRPDEMGEMEELLAGLWREILGVAPGPDDDFFDLGGHSLLATRLASLVRQRLDLELPVRAVFETGTLRALAARVEEARRRAVRGERPPLVPRPRSGGTPVSFAQQRLWFLDQLEPESPLYNIPLALRLEGSLSLASFGAAVSGVVRRHEALRTELAAVDGAVTQRVVAPRPVALPVVDLSALPAERRSAVGHRIVRSEAARALDLARGELVRLLALRLGPREHRVLLTLHHVAADGWSMGVLLRELTALYEAHRTGAPPDRAALPELPVQYGDFALWQRDWLSGETLEAEIDHWRRHLAEPPVLDLPTDRPRPALQGFDGAQRPVLLPAELTGALGELARSSGATLYMVLLTGFAALLSRLSGQDDLVVGTPIANRTQRETEGLIGFFVNMLALRVDLEGGPSFAELVSRVRGAALEAYAHQELPFERVVEELEVPRDLSRNPLFQVVFTLQNAPMEAPELPGVEVEVEAVDAGTARFDLTLTLLPRPDGALVGQVEYNLDLYDATTVERWMGQLAHLLTDAIAHPDRPVDRLRRLGRGERHQVLHEWNDTERPAAAGETLAAELARQRRLSPDAPALVDGEIAWSYRELGARVDRLAAALRRAGAGPGELVGLLCERSAAMVAGLLAILETGAAYLPLDPEYPAERLGFVLDDASPAVVAVGRRQRGPVTDRRHLVLEDVLAEAPAGEPPTSRAPRPDDRAYVIYTSGSTGRPKGVAVTHANACNFLLAMDDLLGPAPGTLLAVTSISFDISVLELLWTLARGSRVVLQGDRGERGQALFEAAGEGGAKASARPIDFSLFYFADASSGGAGGGRYRLLLEGARFADAHGFAAVWTPERHFHAFGGLYPNPSVTGAAVAAVTERISVRAGSVVLPLHSPLRVAEEWSVVDNLSGGRAGLSIASGWHANDFVLAPGTSDRDGAASRRAAFEDRKRAMIDGIRDLRRLWRGEAMTATNALGHEVELTIHPPTVQGELPLWLTAAGNPETFELAGTLGMGLLTHLLSQSHEELAEKIDVYRRAWRAAGHEGDGQVTLMVHTFVDADPARALDVVRGPFTDYLRSSLHLLRPIASSMGVDLDTADFDPETEALVIDRAFERFAETSALFGSPETCLRKVEGLKDLGVDEIGCLVDFGCPVDEVLASFGELDRLHRWANPERYPDASADRSVVAQIRRHRVDTLQCTPSMARLLAAEPAGLEALRSLDRLLLGGEAVPGDLVEEILAGLGGSGPRIVDVYGPTETTVWSTADRGLLPGRPVTVGRPLANTTVQVAGASERVRGIGVAGELLLGGAGVTRGYSGRPAMTAERFLPDPFATRPGARLYRTGDRVRLDTRGRLHFLGRLDHQVKVAGHRIEPGEVEALLRRLPAVTDAVVVLHRDAGAPSLAAYLTVEPWARDDAWEGGDGDDAGGTFRLPDGRRIAHLDAFQTRIGVRELFEEDWYWKHGIELPAEPTVFDVGANVGLFSLQVADRRPDARVIAFEPLPPTFEALRRNVERWVPNGRAVEAGLSDRPGEAKFTFYPQMSGLSGRYSDPKADRSAARAIIESGLREAPAGSAAAGVAGEEVERFLDVELESETHTCRLTTLSEVIDELGVERIDLLKIDVERAELDVLRGLREEHWPRVRQVVAEVDTRENLDAIVALLGERGFEVRVEDFFDLPAADGSRVLVKMVYARRPGTAPAPPAEAPPPRRPVTRESLREHLAAHLPPAAVPSHFVILDTLPRTPNGKIDRKTLPSPREAGSGGRRHVPPQLDSERRLAEVWREVLGVERVGLDENFFEIGGTSLLLVRLRSRIADRLGHEVSLVDLFRYPTVGSLDAFLRCRAEAPEARDLERVDDRAERKRRALEERRRRPGGRRDQ